MIEDIKKWAAQARVLDPGPDVRADALKQVAAYGEAFLQRLPEAPVFTSTEGAGEALAAAPLADAPTPMADVLTLLHGAVIEPGINPAAPGHLGYVPGGGLYYAALGDYLADVTNKYAGVFLAGPGAVRLEQQVLRWMGDLVGYPATMAGDLTSGGSIANLSAVVTAREAAGLTAETYPEAVVYLTAQTHHCVDKALGIAGLQRCHRRTIPLDDRYRMQPAALDAAIHADRAAGRRPWMVIASAGTTDTGAVDPLADLAEIAHAHGLWYHVEGAYGATFALAPSARPILSGIEASDSVVMNPHKGLFIPYGSGAVLVRDGQLLYEAFQYQANYMQDTHTLADGGTYSPADLSPELSRNFRGLRLWLPLKLYGLAAFRAALEEKLLLAQYAHQQLAEADGFEVGPPPDLTVVLFRYRPRHGDADAFNKALALAVQQDGRIFLSTTTVDGRYMLRLAVLSFRTHLDTVDRALDILKHYAARLENDAVPAPQQAVSSTPQAG